jgi:hypothetical protein
MMRFETEVVVPYGAREASLHLRLSGEERTYCGRDCTGWPLADGTDLKEFMETSYACKRCKAKI